MAFVLLVIVFFSGVAGAVIRAIGKTKDKEERNGYVVIVAIIAGNLLYLCYQILK